MTLKNTFKAGYVTKSHGLKGEITVKLVSVEIPQKISTVFLEKEGQFLEFKVEHFSARPDKAFIKLEGVSTIEEAQKLKGFNVFMKIPKRSSEEQGFYPDQLNDFSVHDSNYGLIGKITGIGGSPENPLIEINAQGREILIPINAPFILKVDKRKKMIEVELPDGYLEF